MWVLNIIIFCGFTALLRWIMNGCKIADLAETLSLAVKWSLTIIAIFAVIIWAGRQPNSGPLLLCLFIGVIIALSK